MMTDYRKEWLHALINITEPVLSALAEAALRKRLPLQFHEDRRDFAPLEAFGRSMTGLAPWLEADSSALDRREQALQAAVRAKGLQCIAQATDPQSPDFMNFSQGGQPLVDTAFLAHALLRAPQQLSGALPADVRQNLIRALKSSRKISPGNTNWLFFSAMVEAGLAVLGADFDMLRVCCALRSFREWYKGDGAYGDGPVFHWDYYNSFVIHPMYVDLVHHFAPQSDEIAAMQPAVFARAARYAAVLERMIGPDGSYPVMGRSVCYRFGAFHMLAQGALQHRLGPALSPAGVRCGLTAVIRRVLSAPGLFDESGWLQPGVFGYQPELAEHYINIGSLYLCSTVFLPLGLPPTDPFWSAADEDWTGKKLWSGGRVPMDHALD